VEIFADAHRSTTGHRKLIVRLRKIQENCSGLRSQKDNGKKSRKQAGAFVEDGIIDENGVVKKEFNTEVTRCVIRILGVKKTEPAGDRVIRFLGLFLKAAAEKGGSLNGCVCKPSTNHT